jgi:hypothetical protein
MLNEDPIAYPYFDLDILATNPSVEDVMRLPNIVRLAQLQIHDLLILYFSFLTPVFRAVFLIF